MSNNEKYGSITISPTLITDKEERHDLYREVDVCSVDGTTVTELYSGALTAKTYTEHQGYTVWGGGSLLKPLNVDCTYTVKINDDVYDGLTPISTYAPMPVQPALSIGATVDPDFPFIIDNMVGGGGTFSINTKSGVYTDSIELKILEVKENINQLHEKFIPDKWKAGMNVGGETIETRIGEFAVAGEHAEVFNNYILNKATGKYSHAEGYSTTATGENSHAEGGNTKASGRNSHAEGFQAEASGEGSHAEGMLSKAIGPGSHAEGHISEATGGYSHAEGWGSKASGLKSHAEGQGSEASGVNSHAEGQSSKASGSTSHAEGFWSEASGSNSHAEGCTIASGDYQHTQGKFNVNDTESKYAHIVGNGTDNNNRSNAHTLDWGGNAWYQGSVSTTSVILKSSSEGSTKLFEVRVDDTGELKVSEVSQ